MLHLSCLVRYLFISTTKPSHRPKLYFVIYQRLKVEKNLEFYVLWKMIQSQDITVLLHNISVNIYSYHWNHAFFKIIIKLLKWNKKSWKPSIIFRMQVKRALPNPVYIEFCKKSPLPTMANPLWEKSFAKHNKMIKLMANSKP